MWGRKIVVIQITDYIFMYCPHDKTVWQGLTHKDRLWLEKKKKTELFFSHFFSPSLHYFSIHSILCQVSVTTNRRSWLCLYPSPHIQIYGNGSGKCTMTQPCDLAIYTEKRNARILFFLDSLCLKGQNVQPNQLKNVLTLDTGHPDR